MGEHYELTKRDQRKNAILRRVTPLSPIILAVPLPIIFLLLYVFFGSSTPAAAAFYIFMALISAGIGLALGIILMIALIFYRNAWLRNLREQLAVDGIKTNEVDWFTNELTSAERRALKELDRSNRLLASAYRETLASRLTATRILKSSKNELLLVQKRQNKLKYLTCGCRNGRNHQPRREMSTGIEIKASRVCSVRISAMSPAFPPIWRAST